MEPRGVYSSWRPRFTFWCQLWRVVNKPNQGDVVEISQSESEGPSVLKATPERLTVVFGPQGGTLLERQFHKMAKACNENMTGLAAGKHFMLWVAVFNISGAWPDFNSNAVRAQQRRSSVRNLSRFLFIFSFNIYFVTFVAMSNWH